MAEQARYRVANVGIRRGGAEPKVWLCFPPHRDPRDRGYDHLESPLLAGELCVTADLCVTVQCSGVQQREPVDTA
jgi:hypothetical protein